MAREGNLNMDGCCRVVQTPGDPPSIPPTATFVEVDGVSANNGAFASVVAEAVGISLLTIDDDYLLADADMVDGQIEGDSPGMITIERVSQSQIRVRTDTAFSEDAALPYCLNILRRLF